MDNKIVKNRDEIDSKYKWNVEKMYESDDLWENDFKEVRSMAENFKNHSDKMLLSSENLLSAFKDLEKINLKLEKLFVFSKMKQDEDNGNTKYQALNDRSCSLIAFVGAATSFFTPELMKLSEDKLGKFLQNEELKPYEFTIKSALRMKKHILSKEEEAILDHLSEVTNGARNTFTLLNNVDMDLGTVIDENGENIPLTHGNYINMMESSNRDVRKHAYENMYNAYKSHINTIASLYNNSVKDDVITARLRKHSSSLSAALSGNDISEDVYNNLISVVHDYLPILHEYMQLRKEILHLDELKMYDVYVPLIHTEDIPIPFDEAVKMINDALAPLGKDYLDIMNKGISDGWIDIYENRGKTSGAYSFGSYDSYPYILLNYGDRLQDVLTLIHEMGHSMHSFYTRSNQPFIYGDYSIFVAEVASTVNECLLLNHLLNAKDDVQMKKFLLNRFIEEFRTTLFRQTMFAEFELMTHKHVESGESLTHKWLCDTYDELNGRYFGPALSSDSLIQYEWARIPHFYRAFYVYQYATGFSAATALAKKILSGKKEAVDDYKRFLSMGSSAYPIDELKVAGVDMSKKESIIDAMEMFKNLIDEFKELIKDEK